MMAFLQLLLSSISCASSIPTECHGLPHNYANCKTSFLEDRQDSSWHSQDICDVICNQPKVVWVIKCCEGWSHKLHAGHSHIPVSTSYGQIHAKVCHSILEDELHPKLSCAVPACKGCQKIPEAIKFWLSCLSVPC